MRKAFKSLAQTITNRSPSSKDTKICDLECVAIDQLGDIGSVYNRYEDAISGKLRLEGKTYTTRVSDRTACRFHHGRTADSQNLLRMVGLDPSLRLIILLQMVQPSGIASIINYPQRIDKQTRFLCFHHPSRMESCSDKLRKEIEANVRSRLGASATHIISKVVYGIHAVVVLQLRSDQGAEIDGLLKQICDNLARHECFTEVPSNEAHLLDRIVFTTVYSNIPTLSSMTNFLDVVRHLFHIRNRSEGHNRTIYVLSPCKLHRSDQPPDHLTNSAFESDQIEPAENDLLHHWASLKLLQLRLEHELPELLQGKLQDRLNAVQGSFSEIKKLSDNTIHQVGNLLVRMRKNKETVSSIDKLTSSEDQVLIDDGIRRLNAISDELAAKGQLIRQLQSNAVEYCDVSRLGIDEQSSDQMVKDTLCKNDPDKRIFCATDGLRVQSPEQWTTLQAQMTQERLKNPQLRLMYVDFTYTKRSLDKMVILTSREEMSRDSCPYPPTSVPVSKRKAPLKLDDEYINIVLIGESGVGKSTFINAFANYLQYETLEKAESSEPFVIIPVSFLMTINDNFDEKLVKFGEADPNEDHNHSGQSVTQQCRSYVFELIGGKKLRIIDTPGFGDTRGLDQDELNMELIFSYLHHFSYINGICFLFKPNVRQLNPFLYSCFTQLFRFFGENLRDRLIFCFTNARSTFFAPGDTGPALNAFLQSFPVKVIPFNRNNTFCFDSESFRYLVSLQNTLTYKEVERTEIESSWRQSVEQSRRFEQYLCKALSPFRKNIDWQSVHGARLQIESMTRPVLETLRNILRNTLLHSIHSAIELTATCVQQPTVICHLAGRNVGKLGPCDILLDHLHPASNQCTLMDHISATYRLEYEYQTNRTNESLDDLKQQRTLLCEAAAKLARFLLQTPSQQDPFLSSLTRMIEEEKLICGKANPGSINAQLTNGLEKLKSDYEQLLRTHANESDSSLPHIYEVIKSIEHVPMVHVQLNAIREYDQLSIAVNEKAFSSTLLRM